MITDDEHFFNHPYINIAERSCGIKSEQVDFDIGSSNKKEVVSYIFDIYRNHPSIVFIEQWPSG